MVGTAGGDRHRTLKSGHNLSPDFVLTPVDVHSDLGHGRGQSSQALNLLGTQKV